jgi:hypothetical protein
MVKYKSDIRSWGPAGWTFLKTVALAYPTNPSAEDHRVYSDFFSSVRSILPCFKCRNHYTTNLEKHPIDTESRRTLAAWVNTMENEVSLSNNKPTLPFHAFVAQYVPPSMRDGLHLTEEDALGAAHAPQGIPDAVVYQVPVCFWITSLSILVLLIMLIIILIKTRPTNGPRPG